MKFEWKDVIYLVVLIGGFVYSYATKDTSNSKDIEVLNGKISGLESQIKSFQDEHDAIIVLQTQQQEIKKQVDEIHEQNKEIYGIVVALSN